MRGVFNILSLWKVILLFPLLFFFAVGQSYAIDVTLQWDANTEPDLDGYKVYYGTQSRYPDNPSAYNGTEALQGPSPITLTINNPGSPYNLEDRHNPEYTLTFSQEDKGYFFAVTAYDSEVPSIESMYSNEQATLAITWPHNGFYVNASDPNPYTVSGLANAGANVELFEDLTSQHLGTVAAGADRTWSIDVDFNKFAQGPVTFTITSDGITPPAVTGTYDKIPPDSSSSAPDQASGPFSISWTASDQTSGLAWTELWHKWPAGTWDYSGYAQVGVTGSFLYTPGHGDGTYYFATRALDKAGNWEIVPSDDGDCSVVYICESELTGGEGNGGCFIDTVMSTSINFHH